MRQRPADQADDDRAPERRPEPVHLERRAEPAADRGGQPEQQRVDDEREQAERQDDQRQRQQLRHRLDHGVDQAEDRADHEQRADLAGSAARGDLHAADDECRDPHGDRIEHDPDKNPHPQIMPPPAPTPPRPLPRRSWPCARRHAADGLHKVKIRGRPPRPPRRSRTGPEAGGRGQERRRRVHQKQNPASSADAPRYSPVSAHWSGQKWPAGW